MTRIRVGFLGAGKRVRCMYLPVLRALPQLFEVAGLTGSYPASTLRSSQELGTPGFDDVESLVRDAALDLLVVSVGAAANAEAALSALQTDCAVLLETPLALAHDQAAQIAQAALAHGRPVGVAEQKPYLPLECFKRQVIDAGVLGRVISAHNDFRSYDYHAIAQLRRYLDKDAAPVTARCVRAGFELAPFTRRSDAGRVPGPKEEIWELGTVSFSDGSLLVHNFTSAFKATPFRMDTDPSLRIYGTRGSWVGDQLLALNDFGETESFPIQRHTDGRGETLRYETVLPDGALLVWENAFAGLGFDDDQCGLAEHLVAMHGAVRGSEAPLYSPEDAALDVALMHALRVSAHHDGTPVALT